MTMTIQKIHHPEVVRPIQTTLRSFGVKKQDLEDGVAEVQTRTLEYLRDKPLPADLEQWVAGRDELDARRMVRELEAQFDAGEMPEKGDEILDCIQAGMKYPEIAAELGITAETVRMRLRRMRQLFKARLGRLGITGVMLVLVVLASGPAMAASPMGTTAPPAQVPVPPPRARCAA
jgi:DNA-binding CsgD family transcriptional regulator